MNVFLARPPERTKLELSTISNISTISNLSVKTTISNISQQRRMWQGRTGNGHVAQEQEPDALDKVRSLPMVQTPHFGTLSLPKNRINSQLC